MIRLPAPARRPFPRAAAAALLAAAALAPAAPARDGPRFTLVRAGLETSSIELVELDEHQLVHRDESGRQRHVETSRCLGLFDPHALPPSAPTTGLLELTDGQQLPGQAISNPRPDEAILAWHHPWLGHVGVPLDRVRRVRLVPDAPAIEPGDADAVLLANGDRIEGFVVAIGDPILIEIDGAVVEVPLERAAAVALLTPERAPQGPRLWIRDGTLVDVDRVTIGANGEVRLDGGVIGAETENALLRVEHVAGLLFRNGALEPLAALRPAGIEGPATRYAVPAPRTGDPRTPLGLADIDVRGPIVLRYAVPPGTTRFAADARLPESDRAWGDYELIVRDDDEIVFREIVNADAPTWSINVPIRGSELTIELTEGRHGPVQDRVVLERAMLR